MTASTRRTGLSLRSPQRVGWPRIPLPRRYAPPTTTPAPTRSFAAGLKRLGSLVNWRLDFVGLTTALGYFSLSLTPSLLPRTWMLQGLISGILTAAGYAVGVAVASLGRRLVRWRPSDAANLRWRTVAWRALWCVAAVMVPAALYQGARWQRQLYGLMEMPPPSQWGYLGVPLLAAAIFTPFVVVARLLRAGARTLGRFLGRWVPAALARVAAAVGVVVLFIALLEGVVANGLMSMANSSFGELNGETTPGLAAPANAAFSGSPASLVSWASLGKRGRDFVVGGPNTDQLQRFSGRAAVQPIRAYVGLNSAPTLQDEAVLAVQELERTGAFSRRVLCVIMVTGTGWIDPNFVNPLEYMYNGDSAQVAMQYSYLPSGLSFVVDRERVRTAGRELFNHVYARWAQEPVEHRPKLLVFGESLGVFGAESAFSGIDDIVHRTDGMLLVGPPNSSPLWSEFVSKRDRGTREVSPTYGHATVVRFASQPLQAPATSQQPAPRLVYLQHPSDPVVWWNPQLALHRPDWLEEPRGHDVLPVMRWYPIVTFCQLTADLVFSTYRPIPDGHGHEYDSEPSDAWALLASPDGWTADHTAALRNLMNR
jgi:uncharacterized membrane protein